MTSRSEPRRHRLRVIAVSVTSLIVVSSVFVQTASAARTSRHEHSDDQAVINLLKELVQAIEAKDHGTGKMPSHKDDGVTCGQPSVVPYYKKTKISRIVGGMEAIPHSWPWQVSLQFGNPETGFAHGCGGSVLTDGNFILTAAHCVVNEGQTINPSEVQVIAGIHRLDDVTTEEDGGTAQVRSVEAVIPHADYDTETNDNDIALLRLSRPLEFNENISPICLPTSESDEAPVGTLCTVTGWGTTSSGGNISDALRQVGVPIYDHETCNANYGGTITDNMICAGFAEGLKDSCQGDSGGPFVCLTDSNTWLLNGVVSFGDACALPEVPGIYARVSHYIDWIRENGVNL